MGVALLCLPSCPMESREIIPSSLKSSEKSSKKITQNWAGGEEPEKDGKKGDHSATVSYTDTKENSLGHLANNPPKGLLYHQEQELRSYSGYLLALYKPPQN